MMKPLEVSLSDLLSWSSVLTVVLLGIFVLAGLFRARARRSFSRRTTRHCVHCSLREEVTAAAPKFGKCLACGGVTTKGRSRKLG